MAYNQSGNPYGSAQSGGYGNPYGNTEQHEMGAYPAQESANPSGAPAGFLSQQDFLSRVSNARAEIRSLTTQVQQISSLHQQALAGTDDVAQRRLDDLVAATQQKNNAIRDQIRQLKYDVESTPANHPSAGMKKKQWETLNSDFQSEVRGYLQEEQAYSQRYREQIARQYRIVNPDATEDEVRTAANQDWGNEGVFQTALRSNRTGQASAVLGSVRARHNELLHIEKSIEELAALMRDLDTMVIQQQVAVEGAEQQTQAAVDSLENGNKQIDQAADHARRRRKLKWICAGITVLIILGIALGVGLGVGLVQRATGVSTGGSNGGNGTKIRRMLEELVLPHENTRRDMESLPVPPTERFM